MKADIEAKDANFAEVTAKYESALKEHASEIEAMRNSKRDFSAERSSAKSGDLSAFGQDFLNARMTAKVLGKSFQDTAIGRQVLEKAGVSYSPSAIGTSPNNATTITGHVDGIDMTAMDAFEENIRLNYRAANFFKEMAVTSGKTVIPLAGEPSAANESGGGIGDVAANRITGGTGSGGTGDYHIDEVTLTATRLIAGQFIDNNTDEQVVATIMPIIMNALAHSQAKKVENMIATKLELATDVDIDTSNVAAENNVMTRRDLLAGRTALGNLGVDPSQLVYIMSVDAYNELLDEGEFDDFTSVSTAAAKVVGSINSFYGSPVVVSDQVTAGGAVVANVNSFVIPRLGGVSVETDYEVANQRTAIVSSQTLGFDQIFAGVGASHIVPANG